MTENKPNPIYTFNANEIYFTADNHFGHGNIIRFCNRPFIHTYEMDKDMTERWNNTVSENDYIFIIGDFCFRGKQVWRRYLERLNGKKILVYGNHDKSIPVDCFHIIQPLMNIKVVDDNVIKHITLCHYPMVSWYQVGRGAYQLFGHVHQNYKSMFKNQLNVGVDVHDYYPISYYQINEYMMSDENNALSNDELDRLKRNKNEDVGD